MNEPRKVAIITGAERGIGAGLAAEFRRAGYAVVATSLSIAASAESDMLTVQGDITEADTARHTVEQALDRFGRIDTLVNNAGIYIEKPFTDYTLDDYAAITAVNLTGFFHITQRAIRQMVAQGSGHVVNISTSLVDHANSNVPSALASLTKGALAAVARSLAIEYASRGVRVNAVSLGVIRTPTNDPADPASYQSMAALHPLGRMGEITDVVDGILYLERPTSSPVKFFISTVAKLPATNRVLVSRFNLRRGPGRDNRETPLDVLPWSLRNQELTCASVTPIDYLVDFTMKIPEGTPPEEIERRTAGEGTRVAELAEQGHALRVRKPLPDDGRQRATGLYRADQGELHTIFDSLALRPWMEISVRELAEHPNDPALAGH